MTQEDKELILKDLCARLPYGVKVYNEPYTFDLDNFEFSSTISKTILEIIKEGWKPYLRPISSMTKEEKKKLGEISCEGNIEHKYGIFYRSQDYLNSIHVDYRGLIEKGLALEAPKDMYKI